MTLAYKIQLMGTGISTFNGRDGDEQSGEQMQLVSGGV